MHKWTPEELIAFEDSIKVNFERGRINCPVHLSGGNEEALISIFEHINKQDWVLSTHRNHYHYLLKGGNPQSLFEEIMGSHSGICGGKGRSMHVYDRLHNFVTSGIVGGTCGIGVGIALGIKKKWKNRKGVTPHVWCFVGDGAEDGGHFAEAVRFGVARQLPLTFVVEDNDLAVESTKEDRWHNHPRFNSPNIIRYEYTRKYPHVGVGKHVSM